MIFNQDKVSLTWRCFVLKNISDIQNTYRITENHRKMKSSGAQEQEIKK